MSEGVQDQARAGSSSGPERAVKGGSPGAGPGADELLPASLVSRRQLLQGAGAGVALLGAGRLIGSRTAGARHVPSGSAGEIVIGFVSPQTGALADFATSNNFAVTRIRQTGAYTKGFTVGGKSYNVKIIVADSQSDPTGPPRWPATSSSTTVST